MHSAKWSNYTHSQYINEVDQDDTKDSIIVKAAHVVPTKSI